MANYKYDKVFRDKIISEYNNGKSKSEIKKEYGLSYNTMNYWINNQNNNKSKANPYSKEIIIKVLDDYLNGLNTVELSKKYNIKTGTIYSWIKKNNISRKRGPVSLCKNENYFDNIDTELKAYFLGFIIADGNVSIYNNQYAFKISLQFQDKYVIEKLLDELNCSNHIRDFQYKSPTSNNIYTYSYVSIGNKHLVESLIKLDVIPSKTFNEKIPNISKELIPHLLRGFFDGDGISHKTDKTYSIGFIGNKYILEQIKNILKWDNKLSPHFITNGIFTLSTSNKEKIKNLYNFIYNNATFYLKRKHDKMKAIIDSAAYGQDSQKAISD